MTQHQRFVDLALLLDQAKDARILRYLLTNREKIADNPLGAESAASTDPKLMIRISVVK